MKHAFKKAIMNKNTFYNNIIPCGWSLLPVSTVGYFFYRELKPILPNLIISRLKQKLLIQLINLINPFLALFHYQQQEPAFLLSGLINGAYRGA